MNKINEEGSGWGEEMARSEHENTYDTFIALTKWVTIAVIGILALLLIFVYEG